MLLYPQRGIEQIFGQVALSLVGFEPTPKNLEGFCPDPLDDKPITA